MLILSVVALAGNKIIEIDELLEGLLVLHLDVLTLRLEF